MKLKASADLSAFLNAIQECYDEVFFITPDGDRLNLKSTLSQYLFAASSGNKALLKDGEIICQAQTDYVRLLNYIE